MEKIEAQKVCKKHMNQYVMAKMKDGMEYDGIVESVDDENVYLAVPVGDAEVMPAGQLPMQGTAGQYEAPQPYMGVHHPHDCGCGDPYRGAAGYGAPGYGGIGGLGTPVYGGYGGVGGLGAPGYGGYGGVGGLGTPLYGGYGGYGAGYGRPKRRFQRVGLPLALLTALSGLPYY